MRYLPLFIALFALVTYGSIASARVLVIMNSYPSNHWDDVVVTSQTGLELREDTSIRGEVREVTAYSKKDSCHYPVEGGCLTASGKIATVGMVACPRSISFGSKIEIQGKVYTCEDRLARRYDHRIDIWFDSYEDAVKFGRKKLVVTIL